MNRADSDYRDESLAWRREDLRHHRRDLPGTSLLVLVAAPLAAYVLAGLPLPAFLAEIFSGVAAAYESLRAAGVAPAIPPFLFPASLAVLGLLEVLATLSLLRWWRERPPARPEPPSAGIGDDMRGAVGPRL